METLASPPTGTRIRLGSGLHCCQQIQTDLCLRQGKWATADLVLLILVPHQKGKLYRHLHSDLHTDLQQDNVIAACHDEMRRVQYIRWMAQEMRILRGNFCSHPAGGGDRLMVQPDPHRSWQLQCHIWGQSTTVSPPTFALKLSLKDCRKRGLVTNGSARKEAKALNCCCSLRGM